MPKKTPATSVALLQERMVRRVWHEEQWFFSVIDLIAVLTESAEPRRYWSDLKRKLKEEEGFVQVYEKIVHLKMASSDGKRYATDATALVKIHPTPEVPSSVGNESCCAPGLAVSVR